MLIVLLLSNIVLLILCVILARKIIKFRIVKRQKPFLKKRIIPHISIPKIDPIFKHNAFGYTSETETIFVGSTLFSTSDGESWILSVLAKKSKNIFEFGT